MFLAPGCGILSKDPKMELLTARQAFGGTVRLLTIARTAGAFTKTRGAEIDLYVDLAAQILDDWEARIRLNESPADSREQWREILRKLTAAQIEAERSTGTVKPTAAPTAVPAIGPAGPVGRNVEQARPLNGVPYDDPFNPKTPSKQPLPPAVPPAAAGAFFARRRRRRTGAAVAITMLTWLSFLTEGMIVGEAFLALGQRLAAGGTATMEELEQAAKSNKTDVQAFHDAAKYDRPDPGPTPA